MRINKLLFHGEKFPKF